MNPPQTVAYMNVESAYFTKDEAHFGVLPALNLKNFGGLATEIVNPTVVVNFTAFGHPERNFSRSQQLPVRFYFAPGQSNRIGLNPIGLGPENYASFILGAGGVSDIDIVFAAEYEERPGVRRKFRYIGQFDPKIDIINMTGNSLDD